MDVLVKAQELAEALEKSSELHDLRLKEKILKSNSSAMSLMNEFQKKQMEVYNMQVAGEEPSDKITDELNILRDKLQENEIILDYLKAQEKLGKILEEINYAISRVLQGDDACGEDGCAGCSGCN
ncbi:MAG: YlbF family regulator [Bacillota bacterium]|jgi:cell fate (sporulation/competence/biofilm development) regulator YlbF (YheA/YmcA/DUF963 family)